MRGCITRAAVMILLACAVTLSFAQMPVANKPDPAKIKTLQGSLQLPAVPPAYSSIAAVNSVRTKDAIAPFRDESGFDAAGYQQVKQTTQYLDGLGRLLQTVSWQATPGTSPKDIIAPAMYDQYGEETYKFLPYVSQYSQTGNGSFRKDPFNEQDRFYKNSYKDANGMLMYPGEQFFYNETEFESSPLNRISKVMAPGNSWAGSGKGIKQEYLVNTATDEVVKWNITNDLLASSNESVTNIPFIHADDLFYEEGVLYKNVTKDEHGNAVVEYKNKEGSVLLKKVQASDVTNDYSGYNGWLCTYYLYDELNHLRFVIPPKATEWLHGHNWDFSSSAGGSNVVAELCFRYEYDEKQRMIGRKVPGAAWVYMIYDLRDRLVLSQDARMHAQQQWNAVVYDALNRPAVTGIFDCDLSRESLQRIVSTSTNDITAIPSLQDYVLTPMAVTHFDDYSWINKTYTDSYNGALDASANLYPDNLPSVAEQHNASANGMVTGTDIRVVEDPAEPASGKWLSAINFYDSKGRLI